jgi:hypothetical protein
MTLSLTKPGMLVFSICDVVTLLPNEGRINVLLYAMECLPMNLKWVSCIAAQDVSYYYISLIKVQRGN